MGMPVRVSLEKESHLLCYRISATKLVKAGNVGLSWNSGRPELLAPGWHLLLSGVEGIVVGVWLFSHATHTTCRDTKVGRPSSDY